jgi:Heme oxygenase
LSDLLADLRRSTSAAHERLDRSFGSLDLSRRDDLELFLRAHAYGMRPLHPVVSSFFETRLGHACPNLLGMAEEDVRRLGSSLEALPAAIDPPGHVLGGNGSIGAAYVVCGSRLGLEVIRRDGYWSGEQGFRSRYIEDDTGRSCWKILISWMRSAEFSPAESEAAVTAAVASFDTFAQAFTVTVGEGRKVLAADG